MMDSTFETQTAGGVPESNKGGPPLLLDRYGRTEQECFDRDIVFTKHPPDPPKPPVAYVLLWRYHDRSSSGALRAYLSKERADADFALLNSDCSSDRTYEIREMELFW